MKNILLAILLCLSVRVVQAQPGRPDPSRRVQMEKDSVFAKITDLSEDQQMIIISLYTDYEASLKKIMAGDRTDRMAFRQRMMKAVQEKNQMMKEVLNEDQYLVFETYLEEERKARVQRRSERGEHRRRKGNGSEN